MSDTLATATNLGTLTGNRNIADFVGVTDPVDFFRFTISENSDVGFTFRGLSETVSVDLIADLNGNGVVDSGERVDRGSGGSSGGSFSEALPNGTYFVLVETFFSNRSTNYELNLNVVPRPGNVTPDPGETLNTAFNLGSLSGTRTLRDYVGVLDNELDIYRFTLTQNTDVGFTFSGLSESVSVGLIADRNGNGVIDSGERIDSGNGGSSGGSFSEALPAGTYFVAVETFFSNRSTQYELSLNAVARPGNVSPDPGSTLNAALNLGVLSETRTVRDYVGVVDEVDVYEFTIERNADVGLTFSGLSESVSVALIADLNNNGVIDFGERLGSASGGSSGNSFSQVLEAGTYFAVVETFFSNRSTQYSLAISQTPDLSGNDVLRGTSGRDVLRSLGGDDVISGLSGNDLLVGGDGSDRLSGGSDNDRLVGGPGFDTLLGGSGNDVMIGGDDNDRLLGGGGRDIGRGNQGDDVVNGGGDDDRLFGGDGNDRLNGQGGNDNLIGGSGRDVLKGAIGNDVLNGGTGNDVIFTGPGSDRIIIGRGQGLDRVRDFTDGQDRIVLSGLNFGQISVRRQGNNTLVSAGNEGLLLLQGVNPGQISAADFV